MKSFLIHVLFVFLSFCFAQEGEIFAINEPGAAGVPSWFSSLTYSFVSGDMALCYISGTIGTPYPSKPGPPHVVPGGIVPETNQTLNNIVSAIKYGHNQAFGTAEEKVSLRMRVFIIPDLGLGFSKIYRQMPGVSSRFNRRRVRCFQQSICIVFRFNVK